MLNERRIARRYARAFLNDDVDKDTAARLADEVKAFVKALEGESATWDFFLSPVYSRKDKIAIMNAVIEKTGMSSLMQSVLELLIRKHRFEILPELAEELESIADSRNYRIRVYVTTAVEPSKEEIAEMAERIGTYFDRMAIVERRIDPAIIGGFRIEGEGKLIDMSVKGQIEKLLSRV